MTKIFRPEEAIANAETIFRDRYKGAEFCFAAGSIVTGTGTACSDLDLVVIFPKLENARRESFVFSGMPVEAFVHDYETIQAFMDDDLKDAHADLANMMTTGKILPEETGTARKLKNYASSLMQKGPPPSEPEVLERLRYCISGLIDDLRGQRPVEEQRAILYALYPKMGELALRRSGKFISTGKHLARKLKTGCPKIFEELDHVMKAVHDEDGLKPEYIDRLDDMINSLGGRLFDGYKQEAPATKRAKPIWFES